MLHTVHPVSEDSNQLFGEVVLGLGDTLVGNYPGQALSFSCSKSHPEPRVLAYPSKSAGLYGQGLIFRSDSNAEDLSGYAGAGLYDSALLPPPRQMRLSYFQERLVWDIGFREEFLRRLTSLGTLIEHEFNGPQDIEGTFAKGDYYVVQTRPQIRRQDG